MSTESTQESEVGALGITHDPKWAVLRRFPKTIEDFYHKNDGPWPQPAPENPVTQMAEVIHLPEEELKDWKKNVSSMYLWRVLLGWPRGLWYALWHDRYNEYDDPGFNKEITEGLYSKFMTPLDEGDLQRFRDKMPELEDDEALYCKADFSCMEPVAPNCRDGMYAAPTITLIKKNCGDETGQKHRVLAIYLYQVEKDEKTVSEEHIFTPADGEHWHLAKFFVLQGAVHRVNLTEHALLHFPFDCVNAISRTILPTDHLLFQLLIPHFRLSLGVNKAVLENPGSLINRDQHKFYSPFSAEGKYVRKLLPDGYVGRGKAKENAYPVYEYPFEPKIPDSQYGEYLQAYYDVFEGFVTKVIDKIDDDDKDGETWQFIGLWADCIEEWMPQFPKGEEFIDFENSKPLPNGRNLLVKVVTMIMWDLSVAHATDHIAINNKRPHGNPFRLRVKPPGNPGESEVASDWHSKLVNRKDLLTFWFTDLLFYKPANVTLLQEVIYPFEISDKDPRKKEKEKQLKQYNQDFLKALRDCEENLKKQGVTLAAELKQISASLQY